MLFLYPNFLRRGVFRALAVAVLAMSGAMFVPASQARDNFTDNHDNGNRNESPLPLQAGVKWHQECSACHIAYAPGLLPTESWRKVMSSLDKHFGSDASLNAKESEEITAFLVNNSNDRWNDPTETLRLTETAWFQRRHNGRKIFHDIHNNAAVKSPSNCAACHPRMG